MAVICSGHISVYQPGGRYNLQVRTVEAEGEGDLAKAFGALKAKLEKKGYFDPEKKQPLPDIFTSKPKLRLLLKADTQGTLEAIVQNFDSESIDLIYADIGEVSDSDVEMAKTAAAKILAFQVKVPGRIQQLAKSQQVTIKSYKIIYELIEYLQKKMLKLLEPTIDEVVTGEAKIAQIFQIKGLHIAGVKVQSGEINKNDKLHLLRGEEIIG